MPTIFKTQCEQQPKNWNSRRLTQPIVNSYYCLHFPRNTESQCSTKMMEVYSACFRPLLNVVIQSSLFLFFIISCYCTNSTCTSSSEHNTTATATTDVYSTTVICQLCLWPFNWLLLWFQYRIILWCKYSGNINCLFSLVFALVQRFAKHVGLKSNNCFYVRSYFVSKAWETELL